MNKAHELTTKTKADYQYIIDEIKGGIDKATTPNVGADFAYDLGGPYIPINVMGTGTVNDLLDGGYTSFGFKGTGKSIQYAESGGRNISSEQFFKEEAIAEEVYGKFRNLRSEDVNAFAKNTGFFVTRIQRIKDHVFNNSHIKDHGVERFDPDYELAQQAWQRLIDGKQVDSDIQLLHHEIYESKFEGIFQTNYRTAHDKTIESGRPWNCEKNYEE